MPASASGARVRLACCATAVAVALGAAAAPALTVRATPKKITAAGVGSVKLGKTYTSLRSAGLLGKIGPGCELAGRSARAAALRLPLGGSVDLSQSTPRRVRVISVTRGATARGVGIGATQARIKRAYPAAVVDRSTEKTFGITIVRVPQGRRRQARLRDQHADEEGHADRHPAHRDLRLARPLSPRAPAAARRA